jgi:carbamoyltransferase
MDGENAYVSIASSMFLLRESTHRMLIRYDPDVGHVFVPNLRARIPGEDGGHFVVTNSSGFRSDFEYAKPKPSHFRVLMFGDSYTAGDNVANEDRYSDQLGKLLGAEVQNYGVSGSGTDQHLLIYRKFAKDVEADLVVLCVQIDSFNRIQVSHRPVIDRVTRKRLLVPKPYFRLVDGRLELHQVPVPMERPVDRDDPAGKSQANWLGRARDWYLKFPGLKRLRNFPLLRELGTRAIQQVKKRTANPYPDIESPNSPGWRLMEAILRQFVAEIRPRPVVIVPIPTQEFFQDGRKPIYQALFARLDAPSEGVHVCDVSTPLARLPWAVRQALGYEIGGHFTPMANRMVAEHMASFIKSRGLIPDRTSSKPVQELKASVRSPIHRPKSKYVLGISCFYHNSAASLIRDGEIVAASEEERFSRVKNDRRFPHNAINYCLEEAGISQKDLAAVAFYDNSALTFERLCHALMAVDRQSAEKMWLKIMPAWLRMKLHFPKLIRKFLHYEGLVLQGAHHRSHAASCFYPSPFESAAILTVDGVGEWATATIGSGKGSSVRLMKEMRFAHSLGLLYSAFTHFTGFKVNSGEYKMMGLAPYGKPIYAERIFEKLVDLKQDGSLELNMDYFGFLRDDKMTNQAFADLFGGPRRTPESRITRREIDLARSIQAVTEEVMLRMARTAHELTGEKNLCMAGGVALNCVANGRLLREGPFEQIWIQPAAGDSGCALGVALDVYHSYFGQPRKMRSDGRPAQGGSYLGPEFSDDEIRGYLETQGFPFRKLNGESRNGALAEYLEQGKVVGHFSGRLEFGPRSLGARSILGDPRNSEMQAELNLRIKYRESFRPFAPAVLADRVSEYFDFKGESPYMLMVAPVKESRRLPLDDAIGADDDLLPVVRRLRSDLPAITHVDYSARLQTVRREDHPVFYDLIAEFHRKTGCGVVVNTSFNVRGEPIVCTPQDAYRCFMRTEMDVLALGDYILVKPEQPPWPEGKGEGLESEDIAVVAAESHPPKLVAKLDRLFDLEFWPVAEKLAAEGGLLVSEKFGNKVTTWVDANEPSDLRSLFELPAALSEEGPDPFEFAAELTKPWHGREAADLLKPVLAHLIRAGLDHPVDVELEEQVSESVYVMF